MKTVYLMRHGKSKRGPEYETDFDRPLAKRGKRDAAHVGEFLAKENLVPDLILSSPAERARQSALRCAEAADYMGDIRLDQSMYFGGDDAYLELLWELDDSIGSALLVGHNPDMAMLVETLSGEFARMPTAALARIDLPITQWAELAEGRGQLAWVRVP